MFSVPAYKPYALFDFLNVIFFGLFSEKVPN